MSTPHGLDIARKVSDGWRHGQHSLDAIRARHHAGDTATAVVDRAVLLHLLGIETDKAAANIEEQVARLREDNTGLMAGYEADIAQLRTELNEAKTRARAVLDALRGAVGLLREVVR